MNEQTTKLLSELANKLGTTSEYLWNVLLSQAPISATISLFYLILFAVFGIVIYRVHMKFMKEDEAGNNAYYNDDGDVRAIIMIIAAIIFAILFICQLFMIGNIINGYFNPEYWALKEILSSIKH